MYPDIVNMYIAGAVIPLLLALALCAAGLYVLFGLVRRKRAEMLQTARDEEAIYAEFREMRLTRGRSKALLERHRQERDADISPEQHQDIMKKSSFYYLIHGLINPGQGERSLQVRLLETLNLLAAGTVPSWYVLKAAGEIREATIASRCELRLDRCVCASEPVVYAQILEIAAFSQMWVAALELIAYFLSMPHTGLLWRGLRHLFFVLTVLTGCVTVYLLILNALWLVVAALIAPIKVLPYTVSMVGVIAAGTRYAVRLNYIRVRVSKNIEIRMASSASMSSRLAKTFPPSLLQLILNKNLAAIMAENNLSVYRIAVGVTQYMVLLVVLQCFLFVGFQGFSNPSDPWAASINIGLIISTLLGCDSFAASRAEPVVEALQIQVLEDKISRSIHYVLQQIDDQVTRS